MVTDEISKELCRFVIAGIGRDLVNAVGRLVKTLSRLIDGFRLAFYLYADGSFEYITNDGTGMAVRRGCATGPISDFDDLRS